MTPPEKIRRQINVLTLHYDSLNEMEHQPAFVDTDRDLADAVLNEGSEIAFRELYRRHTPRLLGFVTRLLARSDAEAEDIVQETWIRACGGLEGFRWNSAFSTWLLGIGLNIVRDTFRRNKRPQPLELDAAKPLPASPGHHDERIDLERGIHMLPDRYRVVLVLHDVEGMKHTEIARRLDMPEGTSKSHLSAARKQLRAMLSGRETEGERF
jgi:RNA polymerase sigma-70 factor (ECF subfamily)